MGNFLEKKILKEFNLRCDQNQNILLNHDIIVKLKGTRFSVTFSRFCFEEHGKHQIKLYYEV